MKLGPNLGNALVTSLVMSNVPVWFYITYLVYQNLNCKYHFRNATRVRLAGSRGNNAATCAFINSTTVLKL